MPELEREWPLIRTELARVLERQAELPAFQEIAVDVRTITKDARWKTFFLVGFGVSRSNIAAVRNLAHRAEDPRPQDGDVLDLRARQALPAIAAPITACCGCISR